MASTASSSSSSSSPKSVRASQNSTSEKIAKLTLASSLAGAVLTAAYESTRGRARAIREIEAKTSTTAVGAMGSSGVDGHPVGSAGTPNRRPDATKFYRHNTALLSASAALNSGLVAFAFFSLREHVVSPALAGARRSYGPGGESGELGQTLTWSGMRMHHLEDSAVTGAFLGGAFNAWKKGTRGVFPGAFTASLACTALQFIVNELDVQRVRYVSSHNAQSTPSSSSSTPSTSQSRTQSPTTPPPDTLSLSGNTEPFLTSTTDASTSTSNTGSDTGSEESKPGLGERFLALIGITKVDDAEYLRRLKAKRERHLKRIRELEALEEARHTSETEVKSDLNSNGQSGGD